MTLLCIFIQTVFIEDSDTRLRIHRYCFTWRMPSRLASLKHICFLVFSYFTTKKLLSTVDVPGKMVVRPQTNLYSNGYMLCSPFQSSWYA